MGTSCPIHMVTFVLSAEPLFVGIVFRKYVMVWEVFNTLFMNIWNVGDREPVQSCPALFIMVWEILNLRLSMRNPFRDRLNHVLHSYAIGPANSSVGRASDCSSEGRWFEPDLVDIKTPLTQLVECQPHELKAVGSIPTRGTSRLN